MSDNQNTNNNQILDPEIIAQKGEQIYQEKLKDKLETQHKGEYVAINVENEDYFLAESPDEALNKAKEKYPNAIFHLIRIGYSGVYKVSWSRSNKGYGWLF